MGGGVKAALDAVEVLFRRDILLLRGSTDRESLEEDACVFVSSVVEDRYIKAFLSLRSSVVVEDADDNGIPAALEDIVVRFWFLTTITAGGCLVLFLPLQAKKRCKQICILLFLSTALA
jgi:hypothetical protein